VRAVQQDTAPAGFVARALKRDEGPRIITGRAAYVDNMTAVGTLRMALVRSPATQARVASIDASGAPKNDMVAVLQEAAS
jgi:CO/xanthine dehydrogenase Mo-binding subunit